MKEHWDGVYDSTAIEDLGFRNIIATDISPKAIKALQNRLGQEKSELISWIIDDLTKPEVIPMLDQVDLWDDRAVLHFFLDPPEQDSYFNLLKKLVKDRGFVIIAAFNLHGVTKCSGITVHRYNQEMIQERIGDEFLLKTAFDYTSLILRAIKGNMSTLCFREQNKITFYGIFQSS